MLQPDDPPGNGGSTFVSFLIHTPPLDYGLDFGTNELTYTAMASDGRSASATVTVLVHDAVVPEPRFIILLGSGAALLLAFVRRRTPPRDTTVRT